jgi:cytochrome c55X
MLFLNLPVGGLRMRIVAAMAGALVVALAVGQAVAEIAPDRIAKLRDMVAEDCGACHGMTRKGGLGPPLLHENLEPLSSEAVIETILEGRPGTPMPPWKPMLTREEAAWIDAYLRGEVK